MFSFKNLLLDLIGVFKGVTLLLAFVFFATGSYLNYQEIQSQHELIMEGPAHFSDKKLLNLHPDPFQEHLEASLKWSIKTLSEKDIKYYLHANDIVQRKTEIFSSKALKIKQQSK